MKRANKLKINSPQLWKQNKGLFKHLTLKQIK